MRQRTPIIDCTDLYIPYQDPGDNFDIVAAYALPEIDLRAVILDVTRQFRLPETHAAGFTIGGGPREPGVIALWQMNYIFDRVVPFAVSPFDPMTSAGDCMTDSPRFEQAGVDLFLETLRRSPEPVEVLVFCSCRTLAGALNREPELCARQIKRVHLSIGTTSGELFDVDWGTSQRLPLAAGSAGYREWNVELDVHAFVRVLRSGLSLALYPCASDCGPFALHRHNTVWNLESLAFIQDMHPKLRNYLCYALNRESRHDFLAAMEGEIPPEAVAKVAAIHRHQVWETALWIEVSGRKLVRRPGAGYRIIPVDEVRDDDVILKSEQVPCRLDVHDDGRFDFALSAEPTGITMYDRGDNLQENQRALQEALPELYRSFNPHPET